MTIFSCVGIYFVTLLTISLSLACQIESGYAKEPLPIVGADQSGKIYNKPKDWPDKAGVWNGKGARYNQTTKRLVFETFREDIVGGSVIANPGTIKASGIDRYYIAGPDTGSENCTGTTVLYVSAKDGTNPYGIGCADIHDGYEDAAIYFSEPSVTDVPVIPEKQKGAIVYANQNKDLAAWHPNGQWIIASVEMKRHAHDHHIGNSEIGMFNNIWAISIDGKIWIQLTNYEKTWQYYDPVAMLPYAAIDVVNCPVGAQYATSQNQHPYQAYSSSAKNQPPPASGTMRVTVGNNELEGKVPIVWAERVGLDPKYTWAGVLQLAMADIIIVDGLPALINYRRNLTPTPSNPDGKDLWSNPAGNTVIGAGYEPWAFSRDDSEILFASDVFLSASHPLGKRKISPVSQAFTDVIFWRWKQPCSLLNVTAYNPMCYNYENNAGPFSVKYYGHWEEPSVYLLSEGKADYIAFASCANLVPPWNPLEHIKTFGLDVWMVRQDQTKPAKRITFLNSNYGERWLAYPTATDPQDDSLFLTVVPGGMGGQNPPGTIYKLDISDF